MKIHSIHSAFDSRLVPAIIIGGLLLLAYSNSFQAPFIFDDSGSIHENQTVRSLLTGLFPEGNSGNTVSGRPLLNFTIAINYVLGGENVVGYHIGNLLIHFLASLSLFGLIYRILALPAFEQRYQNSERRSLALIVACIWAIHPLQTESVTYIIQRAESLVGMFYLLTLYCFVRGVESPDDAGVRSKISPRSWLGLSLLACLLGMGSKEVMAGAPLIVLLLDRTFVAGTFASAFKRRKGFYTGLAATWGLLALCIVWTGKRGSTVGYNEFATWWRYGMTQGFAVLHYLKLVFWPDPLVLDYGTTLAADFRDAGWQTIGVSTLAIASIWAIWKRPVIGYLAIFFFSVLAPSSSIVPVLTQTMAEHRMYLALAPVIALVVLLSHRFLGTCVFFVWIFVALLLGARTFRRNHDYRSEESIWVSVTEKCPYNSRGWGAVTAIYLKQNDLKRAKWSARQALLYKPDSPDILADYANILVKSKELVEAEEVLRYTLKLQPLHYRSLSALGLFLLENQRAAEAEGIFRKSIEAFPDGTEVRFGLAKTLIALDRHSEAFDQLKELLKQKPGFVEARNDLANGLISQDHSDEAISILKEGLNLDSAAVELRRSLGLALLGTGHIEEAIEHLRKVVSQFPEDPKTHANLALALVQAGVPAEAKTHFELALKFGQKIEADPQTRSISVALHVSAADAALQTNNAESACEHYRGALKIDPDSFQIRHLLANALVRGGRDREAVDEYLKTLAQAPNLTEARYELALSYARLRYFSEAREQLVYVLKADPSHAGAKENLRLISTLRN